VKDIYQISNGNLLFHFSDRISAFDIPMVNSVPRKGEVLCKFTQFWFRSLGTKHHLIREHDKDKIEVKKLDMVPMECIVRGYLYGSLYNRILKSNANPNVISQNFNPMKAARLPQPIFDPTTKSDEHDLPISRERIVSSGLVSGDEFEYLKETSISLYNKMSKIVDDRGFIIADVKFEFGRDPANGNIVLGDSIGPDEFRLWQKSAYRPGRDQESFDKQLLRDWLIRTGFKDRIENSVREGFKIEAPLIPKEILSELTRRYLWAYEQITNTKM
jgi:phosphoribosylaminoimidazole-succinocarboxamide synthase